MTSPMPTWPSNIQYLNGVVYVWPLDRSSRRMLVRYAPVAPNTANVAKMSASNSFSRGLTAGMYGRPNASRNPADSAANGFRAVITRSSSRESERAPMGAVIDCQRAALTQFATHTGARRNSREHRIWRFGTQTHRGG